MRSSLLLLTLCVTVTGCAQDEPRPPPSSPAVTEPAVTEPAAPEPAAPEQAAEKCLPGRKQTGAGCSMEGIMAAVRPLREAGGPVQTCYLTQVTAPRAGKVLLQFHLAPDGRARGFQAAQDDFSSPGLVQCLSTALSGVSFPAPGDVPCKVVYPFTFVPGAPHGE